MPTCNFHDLTVACTLSSANQTYMNTNRDETLTFKQAKMKVEQAGIGSNGIKHGYAGTTTQPIPCFLRLSASTEARTSWCVVQFFGIDQVLGKYPVVVCQTRVRLETSTAHTTYANVSSQDVGIIKSLVRPDRKTPYDGALGRLWDAGKDHMIRFIQGKCRNMVRSVRKSFL